ncbi:hypothetical protein DUNSADRAFT_1925 [Dunaliella salina]|uniref:Uncharacterized protein n=1 Tax=Dunaliella salina TaxID=3046 RepID=A0ABQ7FWU1_DUNSA|nr:hypothetical protein DUNSADRAFT_1925 [Dunaliella salina]|eukprot:KAF5826836.1 hypothetical protein DUNSADRAFT_1925 [Dunaliella salina]
MDFSKYASRRVAFGGNVNGAEKSLPKAPTLSREAINILQQNSHQLDQAQAEHLIRTALVDKAESFAAGGDHDMAGRIEEILQDGLPAGEVARVVSELSLGKAAEAAAARGPALLPQAKGLGNSRKRSAEPGDLSEAVLKPVVQKMSCQRERWGHFQQSLEEAEEEESKETWQTIMQKRRRGNNYKEVMRDLTGLADHICRTWAARRIQAAWRAWRRGQSVGDAVGGVEEPEGVSKPRDYKRLLQWALRQAAEVRHKQVCVQGYCCCCCCCCCW